MGLVSDSRAETLPPCAAGSTGSACTDEARNGSAVERKGNDMDAVKQQAPLGAQVIVQWDGENEKIDGYFISFAPDYGCVDGEPPENDDHVFFYVEGEDELKTLMNKNAQGFVVKGYELVYH